MAEWKANGIVQRLEVKQVGQNNLDLAEMVVVETYTHQGQEKNRNIPCKAFAQRALDIETNVTNGCMVAVSGYVGSREYNERTYVDLTIAKCEVIREAEQAQSPADAYYSEPKQEKPTDDDGELPF